MIWRQQRDWFPIAAIVLPAAAMTALQLFSNQITNRLIFNRGDVDNGEVWRLFSCHFIHLSWQHLMLNLLGYALLFLLYPKNFLHREHGITVFLLTILIGGSIYFLSPKIDWYLGYSGVLIGLYAYFSISNIGKIRVLGSAIFFILISKIIREHYLGIGTATWLSYKMPVAVDAHLYGAVSGAVMGLVVYFKRQRRNQNST
ncbi:MAG: rrtA [Verrucomicrobiaceae bacterium]|nr:rrtA [Verrucomicrobiaceae bacterium]